MANGSMLYNASTDAVIEETELDVARRTMFSLTLVMAVVSGILNTLVIKALLTLTDDKLRVRFLLINAIFSDMLVAGMLLLRDALQLSVLEEKHDPETGLAYYMKIVVYGFLGYLSTFYQILSAMAVSFDRFYSIHKPLKYHTGKYTKGKKSAVITFIFLISFGLSLPLLLRKLITTTTQLAWKYNSVVLPTVLVLFVFITFAVYITIFVMIMYQRRKRQAMAQNDRQVAKNQVSLAKTFFLINLTYVLMYLPGTLYHSVLADSVESQPVLDYYLQQLTILIYFGNCVVDPLIYIRRIRSIRQLVGAVKCCSTDKKSLSDTDGKTVQSTFSDFTNVGASQLASY